MLCLADILPPLGLLHLNEPKVAVLNNA